MWTLFQTILFAISKTLVHKHDVPLRKLLIFFWHLEGFSFLTNLVYGQIDGGNAKYWIRGVIDHSWPNTKMTSMNGRFKNPNQVLKNRLFSFRYHWMLINWVWFANEPSFELFGCLLTRGCSMMDGFTLLGWFVNATPHLDVVAQHVGKTINPLLMLFFFSVFFSSMLSNALLAHPITFQPTWCLYLCGKGSLLTSQHHAYISLLPPRLLMLFKI